MTDTAKRPLPLLTLALLLVGSLAAWMPGRAAPQGGRAGLVVQFGDGTVFTKCVAFTQERFTGYDLLVASGLEMVASFDAMGAAICKIGADGCPAEDCFCASPPNYWSYWRQQEAAWVYSSLGAMNSIVQDGAVDGWRWGAGLPPTVMPSLEEICAAATPTPTQTDPPPTATATYTRTPKPTFTPSATPPPATPTPIPSETATPTTAAAPARVEASPSTTPTASASPTSAPTATATATAAPASPTPTATFTATSSPAPSLSAAVEQPPTAAATPGVTPTRRAKRASPTPGVAGPFSKATGEPAALALSQPPGYGAEFSANAVEAPPAAPERRSLAPLVIAGGLVFSYLVFGALFLALVVLLGVVLWKQRR